MCIRNTGCSRITNPDQANLGFEHGSHIVARQCIAGRLVGPDRKITDTRKGFRYDDTGLVCEAKQRPERGTLQDQRSTHRQRNRIRAMLDGIINKLVGNLVCRLIPGNTFPLTRTALPNPLHRIQHTLFAIHILRSTITFLTAARTVIRSVLTGTTIFTLLFFTPDNAVLDVNVKSTMAGTVDTAAAMYHLVPGPLLAHQVFPCVVSLPRVILCRC